MILVTELYINFDFTNYIVDKKWEGEAFTRETNPFNLLGAYPAITTKYQPFLFDIGNFGIFNDDNYCELTDAFNLAHPENMFLQKNFMSDYSTTGGGDFCILLFK